MMRIGRLILGHAYAFLSRRFGTANLLRVLLLWLALISLAYGLNQLVDQLQQTWILWTAVAAAVFGWVLGLSKFSSFKSLLLTPVIGAGWIVLTVNRIFVPASAFIFQWLRIYDQAAFKHVPYPALQLEPLLAALNGMSTGFLALQDRLTSWFQGTAAGSVVIDPVMMTTLWGLAVWLVSAWAGWFVRRKGMVIVGLLPAIVLLSYNIYYVNSKSVIWLVFLGGCTLLLQAVNGYRSAQIRWLRFRMDRVEFETTLIVFTLGICISLMIVGAIVPSVSIKDVRDAIHQIIEERQNRQLAKSLGLEQTPDAPGASAAGAAGPIPLMSLHTVGPGPHLSQQVLMDVAVAGYIPPPPNVPFRNPSQNTFPAFYWRGQTYDRYVGSGWVSSTASDTNYQPGQLLLPGMADPLPSHYRIFRQTVQRVGNTGGPLFESGELISSDQPFRASWRAAGDLIGAQNTTATYEADARMQYVTSTEMEAAGKDYPAQIVDRYLQLPSSVPRRVRNLALDLTTTQPTPYDKVVALVNYLRTFPYTLDVPAPPNGRDVADFFLFDLKKGYCDYYATTMIVLARSVGIPARLVIGYSTGTYDYQTNQYVVTDADAHSWVEVYFPGIGWVEFEPTAGLPAIVYPGDTGTTHAGAVIPTPASPARTRQSIVFDARLFRQAGIVLAVLLALALLYLLLPIDRLGLLLRPSDQALATIFRRLYRLGVRWGIPADPARTPNEFIAEMGLTLAVLSDHKRLAPAVASIRADLDWLADRYTRLLYSPEALAQDDHRQAVSTWYRLRSRLAWVRWRGRKLLHRKKP